ncbi:MAG: ribonuclease HI [Clostridia bacterium]|nr:ribonuclease HI [Clostridia bacterium]
MKHVFLYTDGACSGNPGPGGWGAILRCDGKELELAGGEEETTNNRMELTAVIMGLKKLRFPCEVTVVSDSKYVCDAINQHWLETWVRKKWKKADNKPVLNVDLWEKLLELMKLHKVRFEWIKGHDGHPENERCDRMAVSQYQQYLS